MLEKQKLLSNTLASETLKKIGLKELYGKTKVSEIIEDFHENGIILAMIFFALPIAIPLPYPPGFTTIIGMPLIFLSAQMLLANKKVHLPLKVRNYEINNSTLKMISNKIVPIVMTIEKYTKPRSSFAKSIYCEQLVGFICIVASVAIIMPLPFTNAIPAQGVTVMAIGLLNRDGFVILCGFFIALIGIVIAFTAIIGSWVAIKYLFSLVF